jgi:ribonuclease BN (tRNA processing enzyme)
MESTGKPMVYAAANCNGMELTIASIVMTVIGYSIAAVATCYRVFVRGKKTTFLLDAGVVVDLTGNTTNLVIFVTHDHGDHWRQLAIHFFLGNPAKPIVFVPATTVDLFAAVITSNVAVSARRPVHISELCTIVPVVSGQKYFLEERTDGTFLQASCDDSTAFDIEIIKCDHGENCDCVGYCVTDYKDTKKMSKKVRAEVAEQLAPFKGKAYGDELKKLVASGVEVYEPIERKQKLLAFMGDTTHRVYSDEQFGPLIRQFPVCFSECTFWSPENKIEATKRHHTHWEDLQGVMRSMQDTMFIVGHCSQREPLDVIRGCVEEYKKSSENVVLICPERFFPTEPQKIVFERRVAAPVAAAVAAAVAAPVAAAVAAPVESMMRKPQTDVQQ